MEETYYKKVGRRYVPVSYYDSDLINALPQGASLVIKDQGMTSFHTKTITPHNAPMVAAIYNAREALIESMREASKVKPARTPISFKEKAAWDALKEAMGEDAFYVNYPSAYEIAENGAKAMEKEIEYLLSNPTVRAAYEQFLFVCELAYKEKDRE